MNIVETKFKFTSLTRRTSTNRIVLHHLAGENMSVEQIHQLHLSQGWSGIGYHYYIRKDGIIYRGRPEEMVGSHAISNNGDSIGICFEGNYQLEYMGQIQMNAGKELIADIKKRYAIKEVIGHRNVVATECPGGNFPLAFFQGEENIIKNPKPITTESGTSKSTWVSRLQAELNHQFKANLVVDGIVGPKTLGALVTVKKGAKGNLTRLIQEIYGFTGEDLDGVFGIKTEMHTKKIQESAGLTPDGIVGPKTWKYLLGIKSTN